MAERECARCGRSFQGRRDAKYHDDSCRAAAAKERAQSRTKARSGRSTALTRAVTQAIRSAETTKADAGTLALARLYARQIDADPTLLKDLGPQLRLMFVELGMTPKSRAAASPIKAWVAAPSATGTPGGPLDELNERRTSLSPPA